jgi:EmrB/QacA subfamily drug resistance transporter
VITLGVLATSALAYAVSQTMVAPALPEIQHALGVSQNSVTWVLTVYLLTASIATPVLGRLGDMFGKEKVLLWVLVGFGIGSVVAALSHTLPLLIAGRAIQGTGGAVFPLAFGIIRDEFPKEKVAQAIGLISATFGIGGGAGLVLAGVITDALNYEWIFWVAAIVIAAAAVMTYLFVPESPVRSESTKIDWTGAALLSVGLASLLLGVSQGNSWGWSSARVLGLFALAAVVFAIWVRFEIRHPDPLVNMRMMRRRGVWTTNLVGLLVGFGMFSSFIMIPQFVQTPAAAGYGFAASVIQAGLFMLPATTVMLLAGPASGWMGARSGARLPLVLGSIISAAAFGWLALAHEHEWQILVGTAVMGLGIGFAFAAMANAVVESVSPAETGVATGMNTIMRTIGGSIGAQVAASIVTGSLIAGTSFPQESGYAEAFAISAAVLVLAAIVALRIPRAGRGAAERTAEVSGDESPSSPRPPASPVQPRAGRA